MFKMSERGIEVAVPAGKRHWRTAKNTKATKMNAKALLTFLMAMSIYQLRKGHPFG